MFPKGIWPCHTSLAATVPVLTPQLALLPPAWLLSPILQDPVLVCSMSHGDFVKIHCFQVIHQEVVIPGTWSEPRNLHKALSRGFGGPWTML